MRKNEVLTLKGDQINLNFNTITVKVKDGKQKVYPIHPKIRIYLRKKRAGWIFPNPKTGEPWQDLKCALKRAAKKARLDQHLYLHLFRHTFGVHSIVSGIELRTLQLLMGHSSSQVTERYTKLAAQHLGAAIEQFGRGALRVGNKKRG
jgi:site-specific recombinase XerD